MILYVNGDSHSTGHDAVLPGPNPEHSYGKLLADKINYKFVCQAVEGCSNDSIIERTWQYLDRNNPNFIVIGWSTWEREEWIYQGQAYNISASGFDQLPKELHKKYKEFVINADEPSFQQNKEIENHKKIYAFHKELKKRNLPHLFFNCYSWFFYHDAHQWDKFDWQDAYINPYQKQSTYYFWLEEQGYKPSNPKYYHYGADAHEAWAEFLLPKVQDIIHAK